MPPENVSELEAPCLPRAEDYTTTLGNGIRLRVRIVREPHGVFLIADPRGGVWGIKEAGWTLLWDAVEAFLSEATEKHWCNTGKDGSLTAYVPEEIAICLVRLLEEILQNLEWTAWLGMDPTLDPIVPFDPDDGAPVRTTLTPLEID